MPRKYPEVYDGDKFGKWLVLETRIPGKQNTLVRCECGKEKLMSAYHLTSGKSTQCRRCAGFSNTSNEGRRKTGPWLSAQHKFHEYRRGARNKDREWELTFEYFLIFTMQDCHYCGEKPNNVSRVDKEWAQDFYYNGIDRLDNTRGYTLDNIIPCCKYCNYMKRDLTYVEFVARVARIHERHPDGSVLVKVAPMEAAA